MDSSNVTVQPGLVYGDRNGIQITFDHYSPEQGNGAAVIFVNSGGFESGKLIQYTAVTPTSWRFLHANELTVEGSDPIPLFEQFSFEGLLNAGFAVFDVMHGNAPQTLDTMLEDVRDAASYIHKRADEFAIDPDRIGIFGASSGGYLAIAAGLTARGSDDSSNLIHTIATYYPTGFDFPADVAAFPQIRDAIPALAVDDAILDAVSLKNLYQAGGPPTLVIYGDRDFPFIVTPCRSICSEFPEAGIETKCVIIEGVAHEFVRDDGYHVEDGRRAQSEMLQWFAQQLAK